MSNKEILIAAVLMLVFLALIIGAGYLSDQHELAIYQTLAGKCR